MADCRTSPSGTPLVHLLSRYPLPLKHLLLAPPTSTQPSRLLTVEKLAPMAARLVERLLVPTQPLAALALAALLIPRAQLALHKLPLKPIRPNRLPPGQVFERSGRLLVYSRLECSTGQTLG